MNNGVLQFALGLQTGGFLSSLSSASSATKAFVGVVGGSFAGFTAGVMSAIGKGAALEKLHKQTGESVGDLYRLEKGFEAVDVAVENVGPAVLAMQRALGGTNELGENTADIFKRMGLSATELKRVGAARQIEQITTALGKLNASDASKAASSIFGRQNAASMLQIARSADDFQKAIKEAGPQAAVFERVAGMFSRIDRLVASIKSNFGNFFVGIAAGLGPELEKALQKIKGFSDKVGPAIAGAVATGHLEDLVEDALEAAFEQGSYYGSRLLEVVAVGFGDAVGAALLAALEDFIPMYVSGMDNAVKLVASRSRENTDIQNYKDFTRVSKEHEAKGDTAGAIKWNKAAQDWAAKAAAETDYQNKILKSGSDMMNTDIKGAVTNIMTGISTGIKDVAATWKNSDDPNHPHTALDKLNADLGKWALSAPPSAANTPPPPKELTSTSYTYKPEFNAFEKMGFVMRGGSANPAVEYARRTADGIQRLIGLQETTVQLLETGGATEGNQI